LTPSTSRRFGGAATTANVEISGAKAYNYALPPSSSVLAAEATCIQDDSCGAFLVKGYSTSGSSATLPSADSTSIAMVDTTKISAAAASTAPFVQVGCGLGAPDGCLANCVCSSGTRQCWPIMRLASSRFTHPNSRIASSSVHGYCLQLCGV
jgi:hypothetical protein